MKNKKFYLYLVLALCASLILSSCGLLFGDDGEQPTGLSTETPTSSGSNGDPETPSEIPTVAPDAEIPTLSRPTEGGSTQAPTEGGGTQAPTENNSEDNSELGTFGTEMPEITPPLESDTSGNQTETPSENNSESSGENNTQSPTEGGSQAPTENNSQAPSENNTLSPTENNTQAPTEASTEYTIYFYENDPGVEGDTVPTPSDPTTVVTVGKVHKIVKPGVYTISGRMTDGQIRVEVQKTEKVTLVLDNFVGNCSNSAVIYVVSADKVEISVQNVNTLTDGMIYEFENPADTKPNACIYSSEDLEIKGRGTLYVNGRNNNGIGTKNDLEIKNATIYVSAVKNALKGNDSVTVMGEANVHIEHAKDAIKSDTLATEKPGKGFVTITDTARVYISCTDEAIQSTQAITITSGALVTVNACGTTPYKCDDAASISIADGTFVTATA